MSTILSNIITSENYVTVITISAILVFGLFSILLMFGKKHLKVGVVSACLLLGAASMCVTTIKTSAPYIQSDMDAKINESTSQLLDTYAIDSSIVDLP